MREGGENCVKYLKRGWNIKEGSGNQKFKKGRRQAGSRGGCLKKSGGRLEPPYELWIGYHLLVRNYFFSIFEIKIRVFDEVYAYLILQFAVVFQAWSLCKKCCIVYQKLLHREISKKHSKIKRIFVFSQFCGKTSDFWINMWLFNSLFSCSAPSIEHM